MCSACDNPVAPSARACPTCGAPGRYARAGCSGLCIESIEFEFSQAQKRGGKRLMVEINDTTVVLL